MSVIDLASECLINSGYHLVEIDTGGGNKGFLFENDSILGAVVYFESVETLLRGWRDIQSWFLTTYASKLRSAPVKAWNSYTVYLSDAGETAEQNTQLDEIEQDFTGTRKIARCSVATLKDAIDVLLPLIPMQSDFQIGRSDLRNRLMNRLPLRPEILSLITSDEGDPEKIAAAFLREE